MSATFEQQLTTHTKGEGLVQRLLAHDDELSLIKLTHPTSIEEMFEVITLVNDEIKAGERIQVTIPRNWSHYDGEQRWSHIEEVQEEIRGPLLRSNVFATLRFGSDPTSDVVVDIFGVDETPTEVPNTQIPGLAVPQASALVAMQQATALMAIQQAQAHARAQAHPPRPQLRARRVNQGLILEIDRGLLIGQDAPDSFVLLGKVTDVNNPDLNALIQLTLEDLQFAAEHGITRVRQNVLPQAQDTTAQPTSAPKQM